MLYTHSWTMKKLDKATTKQVLTEAVYFLREIALMEENYSMELFPEIENGNKVVFYGYGEDSHRDFVLSPNGKPTYCQVRDYKRNLVCKALLIWALKNNLLEQMDSDEHFYGWVFSIKIYDRVFHDFTKEDCKKLGKALSFPLSDIPHTVYYSISPNLKGSDLVDLLEFLEQFSKDSGILLVDEEGGENFNSVMEKIPRDTSRVSALVFNGEGKQRGDPVQIYAGAKEKVITGGFPYERVLDACLDWLDAHKLLETRFRLSLVAKSLSN